VAYIILPYGNNPHSDEDKAKDATPASCRKGISRGSSVVLRVPSAVIESEYNYLIIPAHIDFKKLV
jgi:hypothetical protein